MSKIPGLPEGPELAILETVRNQVPPTVFTTPYANPMSDSPEAIRNNLREADRLLREAGWELKDRRRVNAKGETLTSIAKTYKVGVQDLQKFNHIENDRALQIGQTIMIPTPGQSPGSSPSPAP